MKKFGEQIPFNFEDPNSEGEGESAVEDEITKTEKKEKRTEDRIEVREEITRERDSLSGEVCYRIPLFWTVTQQPLTFLYYPERKGKRQVRWEQKPSFNISDSWWNAFVNRARSVGADHHKRYLEKRRRGEQLSFPSEEELTSGDD